MATQGVPAQYQLPGVPRLDIPPVVFRNGPAGVKGALTRAKPSTALPAPIALGATFDVGLAGRYGGVIGAEARAQGVDALLGPAMDVLRTPLSGRTFESYGEDPLLQAELGSGVVEGVQRQGVPTVVKHFAANNQEGATPVSQAGVPLGSGPIGGRFTVDARVSERALREIYLAPFEAAARRARAAAFMAAYNRVNGTYMTENRPLLEGALRRDFGFDGFVLSDSGATHNTIAAANGGLDVEAPQAAFFDERVLGAAVAAGQIPSSVIDEHVLRVLRTMFRFGVFDRAAFPSDGPVDRAGHAQTARDAAQAAMVLLRNRDDVLPLRPQPGQTIAVIGKPAVEYQAGGGSSKVTPYPSATPLEALRARAGDRVRVVYDDGSDASRAAQVARHADVALVFAADESVEGVDRTCMALNCSRGGDQDGLIAAVGAASRRTVVVLQTGGPVLTPWRDSVGGLLEAWYPGQEGGNAIARVLFGDAEPGGRLPATFPRDERDEPTAGDPEKYPGVAETVRYKEDVLVGYRWFDARRLGVAYPFGFGLSYTRFALDRLRIDGDSVSVTVRNVGARRGTAVPQLYLGLPEPRPGVVQPPRALKAFARVALDRGERRRVTLSLPDRAFEFWDQAAHDWRTARGCYRVMVGESSRDLPLSATIPRGGARCRSELGLPAATAPGRTCTSRRAFTIHLRARGHAGRLTRARVTLNGRRVPVRRRGRRLVARIDLRGARAGTYTVRVVARTSRGRTVREKRTYHTCVKRAARRRP